MGTKSYKCPSCGAGIHFKPERQRFHCDYCLSEYTEKQLMDEIEEREYESLSSYQCNSCGANMVTDDTTTSTFCYYCHNPVVITGRLQGDFRPNKLIPFLIDKKQAENMFLKWSKKKLFVPKDFSSDSQLEKITGIYIPYWWVDSKAKIDYIGEGRRIRKWRSGNREYTETKKYHIVRQGEIDLNNVEELAFNKIDRELLNGIGPYNVNETIDFSMAYLSGFFAEQYNISKEDAQGMVVDQINQYSKALMEETISGYNYVQPIKSNIDIISKEWKYTLLPTWILTYGYKGRTYIYAVNGQTGKSFGELPLSGQRVSTALGIIFSTVFATLILGGMFIW